MSSRSISYKAIPTPNRSQTQRKINQVHTHIDKKYINLKNSHIIDKKSLSNQNYLRKSRIQRSVKGNQIKDKKKLVTNNQQSKNRKQKHQKDLRKLNQENIKPSIPRLPQKILKAKNRFQVERKKCKINETQQKLCSIVQNSKAQNEMKQNFVNYECQDCQQDQKKPIASLYLKSTNFQDPIIYEVKAQQIKANKKAYPSLRLLNKNKQNQGEKIPRKKRIQSCKFVINPFENIKLKGQRKFQADIDWEFGNKICSQQFLNQVQFNQISEIQGITFIQGSQMDNPSRQIFELMNWQSEQQIEMR